MGKVDEAYFRIREDVYDARFKPNELIVEKDVAQAYGLSKATASEVLHRLCAEGDLTCYPRSGYMVRTLSGQEQEQLKRLRLVVEPLVLDILCTEASDEQLASLNSLIVTDVKADDGASRSNRNFHRTMARLTGDRYLVSIVESILGASSRVEQYLAQEKVEEWQKCHKEIVEALQERDAETAKKKLVEDINQR